MFGPLGMHYSGELTEEWKNTFRSVLEEVRLFLPYTQRNGRSAHQLVLKKKKSLPTEIEAFFDKYGLYTPKIDLQPYKEMKLCRR